jgi:negative regulator of replication initiation
MLTILNDINESNEDILRRILNIIHKVVFMNGDYDETMEQEEVRSSLRI